MGIPRSQVGSSPSMTSYVDFASTDSGALSPRRWPRAVRPAQLHCLQKLGCGTAVQAGGPLGVVACVGWWRI